MANLVDTTVIDLTLDDDEGTSAAQSVYACTTDKDKRMTTSEASRYKC